MKNKIKLITHTDLDGVGCSIILKYYLSDIYDIDISYCSHHSLPKVLTKTLAQLDDYDTVYITDIAPTEEFFHEHFKEEMLSKIRLFDHHKTSLFLEGYDFAEVVIENNNVQQCGTSLFNKHLRKLANAKRENSNIQLFVSKVRSWDTWDWFKTNDMLAKKLNTLFRLKGINAFSKEMTENLKSDSNLMSDDDEKLISYEEEQKNKYIDDKLPEVYIDTFQEYKMAIIHAENYISELGNRICLDFPNIDFVAVIGPHSVSLRTIKNDVDVSIVAQSFGGGGHAKASGFPIPEGLQRKFVRQLFFKKD